jgi:hypothetical protein
MTHNLRLFLFGTCFAIAVPGCGGGGSGDDDPTTPDAPTTDTPDAPTSATPVALQNVPSLASCPGVDGFSIAPVIPAEVGHLAAARLAPDSYPVDITSVGYDLAAPQGSADCDLSLAHAVEVYVDSGVAPAMRPSAGTLVHRFDVPAGPATNHAVELDLPEPVRLTTGQSLFVAVKLTGNDATNPTRALCIAACRIPAGAISDVDYWSNAAVEPYPWADMVDDFGFTYNYTIRAAGTRP